MLPKETGRIQELDGLRAIAALSVFVYHSFGSSVLMRVSKAGWAGVDLFFVISGYLITTILLGMRDQPNYFKNFYMRRTLRIFPPYYLLFAICGLCAALTPHYRFAERLWVSYALYITSLVVFRPWYQSSVSHLPGPVRALDVTWSLSIEELFYLLWAPAVRFLKSRQLFGLLVAVILLTPALRWHLHTSGERIEYYFFPARVDALAFGSLLALWRMARPHFVVRAPVVALSLIACACALLGPADAQRNSIFAVVGYSLVAVSMTLSLAFVMQDAGSNSRICRLLRSKALVYVGTVSYMFYLLHLLVIRVLLDWVPRLSSNYPLNRMLQILASFVVTLALSALSWKFFETPILRLKARFTSLPQRNKVETMSSQEAVQSQAAS